MTYLIERLAVPIYLVSSTTASQWLHLCNHIASITSMATLHVRNIPERLYDSIRTRAGERERSISSEVIRLLERAVRSDRPGVRELLDEIESDRPVAKPGTPSAADIVREDRER